MTYTTNSSKTTTTANDNLGFDSHPLAKLRQCRSKGTKKNNQPPPRNHKTWSTVRTLEPLVAQVLGERCAMIISQLHYWIGKKCGEIHWGARWIYNSYKEWQVQFPWLGVGQIGHLFRHLEAIGVVLSDNFNRTPTDRVKWYTIDYHQLAKLTGWNPYDLDIESGVTGKEPEPSADGQQEAPELLAGSRGEDPLHSCMGLRPCSTTLHSRGRSGISPFPPAPFPPASSGELDEVSEEISSEESLKPLWLSNVENKNNAKLKNSTLQDRNLEPSTIYPNQDHFPPKQEVCGTNVPEPENDQQDDEFYPLSVEEEKPQAITLPENDDLSQQNLSIDELHSESLPRPPAPVLKEIEGVNEVLPEPAAEDRVILTEVREEVGSMNPQLKSLVLTHSIQEVRKALKMLRERRQKKELTPIGKPAAWLADCLKNRRWSKEKETVETPIPKTNEEKLTPQQKEWYVWAISEKIVDDVPLNFLPVQCGSVRIRVFKNQWSYLCTFDELMQEYPIPK